MLNLGLGLNTKSFGLALGVQSPAEPRLGLRIFLALLTKPSRRGTNVK